MSQKRLVKRSDGRYRVYYGEKCFYGKTKAEAEKKRDEYTTSEKAGLFFDLANQAFGDYAKAWVTVYRNECKEAQQKQYLSMVDYATGCLKNKPMRMITATDIQSMCNKLSVYSASYVSKFMSLLRSIFRVAHSEGAILHNPMETVRRPKCKKTEGHRALDAWERELIISTYAEHEFGLCAMVMLYTGLRRGEALHIDIDRDVDFDKNTITVRGAVGFINGNQPVLTEGKTKSALRTIPMVKQLVDALRGHHGLLCSKKDGTIMSQAAFDSKFESYILFLETRINGCHKRWYGKTKQHKAIVANGGTLPPWKSVTIRCHDFRVDFCTRCYYAGIPIKTLQMWMGHSDIDMILKVYSKLSKEQEKNDALKLSEYLEKTEVAGEII